MDWISIGPQRAVNLFGIRLVGFNAENGRKLLITIALLVALALLRAGANALLRACERGGAERGRRWPFWARQAISLLLAVVAVVGVLSIWFNDPTRMGTFFGLITAGLAFALQRAVTAFAGYFVILRGRTFNVGDRIVIGAVRGDVIALGFFQTTIMEMGQPPAAQGDPPASWVRARQYTGRVVTVSNAKVFDEPIFNYTRELPYVWEEMVVPIAYRDDRAAAERILVDAARRHTEDIRRVGDQAMRELEQRYLVRRADFEPRVYLRLTDNWAELTLRFPADAAAARDLKDRISRDIIAGLDRERIGIASATFEVVGVPPLRIVPQPEHAHG